MEGGDLQGDSQNFVPQTTKCKDNTPTEEKTEEKCTLKGFETKPHGDCLEEPIKCISEESSRLSTDSFSSNEKASVCADFYDSDRPVSIASTASSGSLREGHDLYENILSRPEEENQKRNSLTHLDMELVSSAAVTLEATYREMQSGLKNSHSANNNNNVKRRSRIGSKSLSPFGTKVSNISNKLSYVERVVLEIIETERMYVQDLRSIIEDYLGGIIDKQELPMKPEQVSALFGNIEDIYELNSELLQDLDSCSDDPVAVARCFVEKSLDFDIYTQYCNNYPNSVATLTECMRNKVLAKFFREKQELLKQPLPLGAYLLKPVQRILKYHLLLQEIAKHFDVNKEGYEIVEEAIETMTGVAWYINDMKRKHEHAVRQQEIQSLLLNWNGMDLTAFGELVLEGTFRVQRARNERTFFLFDKALLITKKRGDHFVYKTHIPCASLMLIENTRESLCFTLTHYKNSKQHHNVQAKTAEEKRLWTHHIKKLILENHHAIIPQKAKEAILEMDDTYPRRYKYSPERVKKAMSTDDPLVTHRSGRRRSEPPKHILKQLGEKVGLKHAESDGVLLEFGHIPQPSNGSLTPNFEQLHTEGDEKRSTNPELNRGLGEELSASEDENDEEIQLGDDDENKDLEHHEISKGFKRQNSQCSGNPEKRRSMEVTTFDQEMSKKNVEVEKENSGLEEFFIAKMVSMEEVPLEAPIDHSEDNQVMEKDRETDYAIHDPLDNGVTDNTEQVKAFSSEEEEEETPVLESASILPPSVLDQASVIAERFVNNISRRSSLALEDVKVIDYKTPTLTSQSSSLVNLNCTDKILVHQNGAYDFLDSHNNNNNDLSDIEPNIENTLIKTKSTENVFEEKERPVCKRRESILSMQDRQLLNKIKSYYDKADHQDASFSIKRRESLTHIPTGLVRNSIFKINCLPRYNGNLSNFEEKRQRMDSSSSDANIGSGKLSSWVDVSSYTKKKDTNGLKNHNQHPILTRQNRIPQLLVPITDDFKSPSSMVKVWEEMEKHMNGNRKDDQATGDDLNETSATLVGKTENNLESREPLIIVEESDLSSITEEPQSPIPDGISPEKVTALPNIIGFNDQGYKTPVTLHASFMRLANCMDGDLTEKMKNKVYQLARQYSQRIKCNTTAPHRYLRELEDDMRRDSLPSLQEEKQEDKCKIKPTLNLPTNDNLVVPDHSPMTPTSANFSEKRRLLFSESPETPPVRSDCKSPLSPVKTEKFNWPDVRELRSRYASTAGGSTSLSVSRSLSVPEKIMERNVVNLSDTLNKEVVGHSYIKHSSSVTDEANCLCKVPIEALHISGRSEAGKNTSDFEQMTDNCYYISAEAPLENNKKVIIMEKLPTDLSEFEKDDTYVHIRSPTTREKISLKAVIERCKAYQESEEYKAREELLEANSSNESAHEKLKTEAKLVTESSEVAQESKVQNLRKRFQNSSSIQH